MISKCSKYCIYEYESKGFKFLPSDQEICEVYLKSKIQGRELSCKHLIVDENMYGDYSTPWEIFKSDDPRWFLSTQSSNNNNLKKIKKVIYVFTSLKKKGRRVLRTAGCGTWNDQNKKAVKNKGGDAVIGFNRLLTFKINDKNKTDGDQGKWTMHEYTLEPNDYNYALCKITKEEDALAVSSYNNQTMVVASMVNYEQPSLLNVGPSNNYDEEFSDCNIVSDMATTTNLHNNELAQQREELQYSVLCSHLGANFEFYYNLQQQLQSQGEAEMPK